MTNGDDSKKKLIEFLWVEINRAILNSREVQSTIKILQDLDLLDQVADYNLVLDVQALIDLIEKNEGKTDIQPPEENSDAKSPEPKTQPRPKKEEPKSSSAVIDGKKLSPNEALFQSFLEKSFDEAAWMKKAGIRFLN